MAEEHQYRPQDVEHYPLHMVVGIVPAAALTKVIDALVAGGVAQSSIDAAQGNDDAQRIVDETEGGLQGRLSRIFSYGEEKQQREQYVQALRGGEGVIRVQIEDDAQKVAIGRVFAAHDGRYVNYYGRWTTETLVG